MDQVVDEAVRALEQAFEKRDFSVVAPYATPDFVLDWSQSIGPLRGTYQGIDAARRMFENWAEAFSEMRRTTRHTRRFGHRVLVSATIEARGAGSGVEATAGTSAAEIWTLDGDRIARIELVPSVDDAWRSVRLARLAESRVYFVCEAKPRGEDPRPLLDAALRGGADIVQLRDPDLGDDELVEAAGPFRDAAAAHGGLFVVNDRPDLVEPCGADGVHVGQDDAPVAEARRIAGPAALIGLSTHSAAQVDAAEAADAEARPDQISVGPVWETPTKPGRPAAGLELLGHASRHATIPWFAIGGIDLENVSEVVASGAERLVVVRAIRDADDPEATARTLRNALPATYPIATGREAEEAIGRGV